MTNKFIYTLLLIAMAVSTSAKRNHPENPEKDKKVPLNNYSHEVILQWNEIAQQTMAGPTYNPLLASRILAMVHIAMHDALNGIEPMYETYVLSREERKAEPVAAASAAAHGVLAGSFPDKKQQLDKALEEMLKKVKDGNAKTRGLTLGTEAANAILKMRYDDGAFANPVGQANNPPQPGLYQHVPPMLLLYAPSWTTMKTFGLSSPSQFRVAAMPALNSMAYAEAFLEVKRKGAKVNSTRTTEETFIAKFWYELSEIGWNRVAITAAKDAKMGLLATARLLALVNIALADSYTAGWDSKFHYNFWRPYTAIREAAADNNNLTMEDASWEPLMDTPPVHDYPSTHSVLGSAAATVLNYIIGSNVGFTMTSTTAEPANATRTFKSFTQAAIENGDSRVWAGIHFRFSCEAGLKQGEDIGNWVISNHLKPRNNSKGM